MKGDLFLMVVRISEFRAPACNKGSERVRKAISSLVLFELGLEIDHFTAPATFFR
jgi:hypothetical protein